MYETGEGHGHVILPRFPDSLVPVVPPPAPPSLPHPASSLFHFQYHALFFIFIYLFIYFCLSTFYHPNLNYHPELTLIIKCYMGHILFKNYKRCA